jgi:3'-5' exoribonuclease
MKSQYLKDLKAADQLNNIPFAVLKSERKLAKNGKEYADVTLADKTGSILGRIWSEKFESTMIDSLHEGMVVDVTGQVTEYQGKLQIVVTTITPSTSFDDEDFIPVSTRNIEEMYKELEAYISSIQDQGLKALLHNIFQDSELSEKFKTTAASMKMHHAYKGGLLEHVLEVLAFAMPMIEFYPPANRDLVVAGVILHDIGKVEEIIWKNLAIEYSTKGRLLGHITIANEIIDRFKPKNFDADCEALLKHIILSHHGKFEYGSPVLPATIEAKIVSLADESSAKLRGYKALIDGATEQSGDFSEYSRSIETAVYLKEFKSTVRSNPVALKEKDLFS